MWVLEITGTNLKAGVPTDQPKVLSVEFDCPLQIFPPDYCIDHSLTPTQKDQIVKNLLPKYQQEVKEYEKNLGHFLPLREEAFPLVIIRQLVQEILSEGVIDGVVVVDHHFSNTLKSVIRDTLEDMRVQEIVFLPWSVLAVYGANETSAVVVYFTMECVNLCAVCDLREVTTKEDARVNLLNKEQNHDVIQELIDEVIERSPIELRSALRETIIILGDASNNHIQLDLTPEKQRFESRHSVGCWLACASYTQRNYVL